MHLLHLGAYLKCSDKLQKVTTAIKEKWRKRFEDDSGMRVEDVAGIVIGARPQPSAPSPHIRPC
jgi:hypothetical protein